MPDWWTIELPRPPSVNRLAINRHTGRPLRGAGANVQKWMRDADRLLMAAGKRPRLRGPFEVNITLDIDQFGRFDADNIVKPLLDWLQHVEIIENDKWCRQLVIHWAPLPITTDCCVAVRQWVAA